MLLVCCSICVEINVILSVATVKELVEDDTRVGEPARKVGCSCVCVDEMASSFYKVIGVSFRLQPSLPWSNSVCCFFVIPRHS